MINAILGESLVTNIALGFTSWYICHSALILSFIYISYKLAAVLIACTCGSWPEDALNHSHNVVTGPKATCVLCMPRLANQQVSLCYTPPLILDVTLQLFLMLKMK